MSRRVVEIAGFLVQNGWENTRPTPLDADLSPRRYARLERAGRRRAILMDADEDQKTPQFVALSDVLHRCGIAAPEILAADAGRGLVLMEDFGDRNFGRMIDSGTERGPLYRRAVSVLVQLHKTFDTSMTRQVELPTFDAALFTSQAELFLDAYIPFIRDREATVEERESFCAAWQAVLRSIDGLPQTLMLRDFMPDNLMDLPEREGVAATGVLDFQDAGYGPIAYDLASLCETVRRDGGDTLLDEVIDYYHARVQPRISATELAQACRILAAQRHMRILGLVARYVRKTGRREKLDWLPRINNYIARLLLDEALEQVREWMKQHGLPF